MVKKIGLNHTEEYDDYDTKLRKYYIKGLNLF